MSEVLIMVAPNGARRTPADHPALPITSDQIGETARACRAAGAGAIHLHVRDSDARHSLDPQAYRSAIAAISASAPDLVIQPTTEAAGVFDLDHQIAAAQALRPACLSFSIAEMMRDGGPKGMDFLGWAAAAGSAIQFILYTASDVRELARLWRANLLGIAAPRVLLVAGRYSATLESDVSEVDVLHGALRTSGLLEAAVWMACAFGRGELACLERVVALGGHARVGFENAIVDDQGRPARDNAQRVALVAEIAHRLGRPVASPAQARAILGLAHPGPLIAGA